MKIDNVKNLLVDDIKVDVVSSFVMSKDIYFFIFYNWLGCIYGIVKKYGFRL